MLLREKISFDKVFYGKSSVLMTLLPLWIIFVFLTKTPFYSTIVQIAIYIVIVGFLIESYITMRAYKIIAEINNQGIYSHRYG